MKFDRLKEKKSELLIIIVSSIIIAFSINFIVTYLFSKISTECKYIIFSISLGAIILSVTMIFLILVNNVSWKSKKISFPLTMDKNNKKFIDLPLNPWSVNTRVDFNSLPVKEQKNLMLYNKWGEFLGSELNRFLNLSIQSTLLGRIINSWLIQFTENDAPFVELSSNIIPTEILENPYFLRNYGNDPYKVKIYGPDIKNIYCYGENNSCIKIITKQGILDFSWYITYTKFPNFSKYFIQEYLENENLANDIEIKLEMKYHIKKWKAFSKKAKKLIDWCGFIEGKLDEFDWHNKDIQRMIMILKKPPHNK